MTGAMCPPFGNVSKKINLSAMKGKNAQAHLSGEQKTMLCQTPDEVTLVLKRSLTSRYDSTERNRSTASEPAGRVHFVLFQRVNQNICSRYTRKPPTNISWRPVLSTLESLRTHCGNSSGYLLRGTNPPEVLSSQCS